MKAYLALATLACIPSVAFSEDCLTHFPPANGITTATLSTLNKNGISSYAQATMAFRRGIPNTGRPDKLVSNAGGSGIDTAPQVFSDRTSAFFAHFTQRFDGNKPDQITMEITHESSPLVTVTLASWSSAKASFRASCSPGGVMHGSTPDVDYLIKLTWINP
jgi:hypothetical protein